MQRHEKELMSLTFLAGTGSEESPEMGLMVQAQQHHLQDLVCLVDQARCHEKACRKEILQAGIGPETDPWMMLKDQHPQMYIQALALLHLALPRVKEVQLSPMFQGGTGTGTSQGKEWMVQPQVVLLMGLEFLEDLVKDLMRKDQIHQVHQIGTGHGMSQDMNHKVLNRLGPLMALVCQKKENQWKLYPDNILVPLVGIGQEIAHSTAHLKREPRSLTPSLNTLVVLVQYLDR